ncbi:meiosis 1 arrest protein isoform 2-T3 [Liasis olivaceus]
MSPGRQRPSAAEKHPAATTTHSRQSPRILVIDIHPPQWDHTCHKLCEALENVFCLACSLTGPPRIPSFSLYVVQNQQECLLPFVITVLTSQPSRQVASQLDAGLQGIDLVSLHQLQVVEISQREVQELSSAEWGREGPSSSGESATILNTEIDLHTVENDVVALEDFFKAWLHDHSPDQEHLHLLLPAGTISSSAAPSTDAAWVKCDVRERFLSPAQLPEACDGGTARMDNAASPFWMVSGLAPRRLRVLRALKADGVCASVLSGLPLVIRPTSCWQLSWDELETNQQSFQALCHCLRKREWLLLAKYESQGGPDLSRGLLASTFQVLLPSDSSTLLLHPVVARELLLPCGFPLLPADPPAAALAKMEGILSSLELEASYDPLRATSHLYQALKRHLGRLPASRAQRWAPRQRPCQVPRDTRPGGQQRWAQQPRTSPGGGGRLWVQAWQPSQRGL